MAIALIVAGCALAAYGASIMLVNSGTSFFLVWYALAGACLVPGIAGLVAPEVPVLRTVRWAAAVAIGLIAVVALGMSARIMTASRDAAPADLDYLIVLGAQVRPDGSPSEVLRFRLEAAADYLDNNPGTRVIVCGGQGPNEPETEAACMARWLEERGTDPERIVREDRSKTTAENLANAAAIIDPARDRVGVVTNDFHLFRALEIARNQGIGRAWGIPAYSIPWYLPNNLLRECLAIAKNTLLGTM